MGEGGRHTCGKTEWSRSWLWPALLCVLDYPVKAGAKMQPVGSQVTQHRKRSQADIQQDEGKIRELLLQPSRDLSEEMQAPCLVVFLSFVDR